MIERRRRGVFGWIMLTLFWAWHVLMIAWFVSSVSGMATVVNDAASEAQRSGAAIGATLGVGIILFFWVAGTLIFGALAFFTRGRREIIEVEV